MLFESDTIDAQVAAMTALQERKEFPNLVATDLTEEPIALTPQSDPGMREQFLLLALMSCRFCCHVCEPRKARRTSHYSRI